MPRQHGGSRKGIKLPFALQKELGIEERSHGGGRRPHHGSVRGRKEQRKTDRLERRRNLFAHKRSLRQADATDELSEDDVTDEEEAPKASKAPRKLDASKG